MALTPLDRIVADTNQIAVLLVMNASIGKKNGPQR